MVRAGMAGSKKPNRELQFMTFLRILVDRGGFGAKTPEPLATSALLCFPFYSAFVFRAPSFHFATLILLIRFLLRF